MLTTNQDITMEFKGEEITIPKGTILTHQTAMGSDPSYHFVNDLSWVPDHQFGLKHDMEYSGININSEFVNNSQEQLAIILDKGSTDHDREIMRICNQSLEDTVSILRANVDCIMNDGSLKSVSASIHAVDNQVIETTNSINHINISSASISLNGSVFKLDVHDKELSINHDSLSRAADKKLHMNSEYDIDKIAEETEKSYSRDRYDCSCRQGDQWRIAIQAMFNMGMDETQIIRTLDSKHMRKMADYDGEPNGESITAYIQDSVSVMDSIDDLCPHSTPLYELFETSVAPSPY